MSDLLWLLRQSDPNNEDGSFFSWPGLGLGVATLIFIFAAIKCSGCIRRRSRHENRASVLPVEQPSQPSQEGPFARSPDTNQQPVSVPPRAVYMGGRYILFPAESQPPPWVQHPYPAHLVGVHSHASGGPADAQTVPRFNPDDLVSFDVTGEDKKNPCPICLGLLEEEPVSTGQCLHLMHSSCLKSWLAKDVRGACPVCRVSYVHNAANDIDNAMSAADGENGDNAQAGNANTIQTTLPESVSLR